MATNPPLHHPPPHKIEQDTTAILQALKAIQDELVASRKLNEELLTKERLGIKDAFSIAAVVAGLIITGVFGYYAKPAYNAAQQSNELATQNNVMARDALVTAQLANYQALVELCFSAPLDSDNNATLNSAIWPTYPSCLVQLIPDDQSLDSLSTSTSSSSSSSSSPLIWENLASSVISEFSSVASQSSGIPDRGGGGGGGGLKDGYLVAVIVAPVVVLILMVVGLVIIYRKSYGRSLSRCLFGERKKVLQEGSKSGGI